MKNTSQRGLVIWGVDSTGNSVKILVDSDGTVRVDGVVTISGTVDVSDRAARLLGKAYGSQGQPLSQYPASPYGLYTMPLGSNFDLLSQSLTTSDLLVELRTSTGTAYDARQIRALLSSDVITAYGSQTQALLQRATTYDLLVQLRTAGIEYDARQIRSLISSDVVSVQQTNIALLQSYTRWGIPREPTWTDGSESTAPGAGTALVSKTVTTAKTGRVFGVHISSPEANEFQLYSGASVIKRFAIGLAGVIHIVLPQPLLDSVAAGTAITIKNVNAGGAGKVYQCSLLYDEA